MASIPSPLPGYVVRLSCRSIILGLGWHMGLSAVQQLELVDGDAPGWMNHVRQKIYLGVNFFLLLPKQPDSIKNFCEAFEMSPDCEPDPLTKADFFLLSQYVGPGVFDQVMNAWTDEHHLLFVEQLDFPVNHPPRVKPYLVYSTVWGIIAQADNFREARQRLAEYEDDNQFNLSMPEATVYQWTGRKWALVENRRT